MSQAKHRALGLMCAVLLASLIACSGSPFNEADEVPDTICGTKIDPDLTQPLLEPGEISEDNRVDWDTGWYAPCVIAVDGKPALYFTFSWHTGTAGDLLKSAAKNVAGGPLDGATHVDLGFSDSVVANHGAIATTRCKSEKADNFTLRMFVSRASSNKPDLRPTIEKFMRTYMTETVKTLKCG
ncbi:hypothetical protein ACWGI8_06085 [Streptomyces sp. NPDC054841]